MVSYRRWQSLFLFKVVSLLLCVAPQLIWTVIAASTGSCPTGPLDANLGWEISDFRFMVYNKTQPDSDPITTSHINLDIHGGFTNRTFHCEATSPAAIGNSSSNGSIWINCTTISTTEYTYTTSIQYNPGDWNLLTIRELAPCEMTNLTST